VKLILIFCISLVGCCTHPNYYKLIPEKSGEIYCWDTRCLAAIYNSKNHTTIYRSTYWCKDCGAQVASNIIEKPVLRKW